MDIALIRYYFGSKEALWRATIDRLAEVLAFELQDLLQTPSPSATEELKAVIGWFVDISARWPQLSRIVAFDGNPEAERGDYVKEHLVPPFYAVVSERIENAQSEDSIAEIASRTLFFMITHGGSFPIALPVLTNALPRRRHSREGEPRSSRGVHREACSQMADALCRIRLTRFSEIRLANRVTFA